MGLTKFPYGILATPVVGGGGQYIPPTTGNVYFVDSNGGTRGDGKSPETALATIDAAYNLCTASKGDQIWVMPGHAETISGATSLVMDTAGIGIFGLGEGRNRPVLTFSATTSHIDVSGANNRVSNIVCVAGISAVVAAFDVDAAATDFVMDNCEFNYSTTAYDFVIMLDLSASVRSVIRNCKFIAEDTAGSNEAILMATTLQPQILNCWFAGDYTNAMIYNNSGVSVNVLIDGCTGHNSDVTLGASIDINVASTGTISNCNFSSAFTLVGGEIKAVDTTFDPGSCGCVNCFMAYPPDQDAVPVPFGRLDAWRIARKAVTFSNAAKLGTVGTIPLFTLAGTIEANLVGIIGTSLGGTSGTISVGVTGDADALLGISTGTDLDANEVWIATAGLASAAPWTDLVHRPVVLCGAASPSIFASVATAHLSSGQCDFHLYWRPLEPGAGVKAT